jgi:atypical dual specificity phosphatase
MINGFMAVTVPKSRRWRVFAMAVAMSGLLGGTVEPAESPEAKSVEVDSVPGFSWVEQDTLAAMARPGRERDLEEDLAWLHSAGIRVLVSLTEEPVPEKALEKYGMTGLHLPVEDFTPPTLEQMDRFIGEVDRAKLEDFSLGIHCTAGKGRTGTMLAAYLVTQGLSAEEAIEEIRNLRPGSVETPDQEEQVAEFARRRDLSSKKKAPGGT